MLQDWQENLDTWVPMDIPVKISMNSNVESSRLTYKIDQDERDGAVAPASEDELLEVEHLLAEPKHEKVSVDGLLCVDIAIPQKCLTIEDFPGTVDHDHKTDSGMLDSKSNATQEWNESKFEFLEGILQDAVDEDLHLANGVSSSCDDYLLDTGFGEKFSGLDYGPCEGSHLENLGFESCLPGSNEQDPDGAQTLVSPLSNVPTPETRLDQNVLLLEKMTIRELHEVLRSTFGRATSVKDKSWLIRRISFGFQNLAGTGNVSSLSVRGISSDKNESEMLLATSYDSPGVYHSSTNLPVDNEKPVDQSLVRERFTGVGVLKPICSTSNDFAFGYLNLNDREKTPSTGKRLRKPTRRYIEESSDLKLRHSCGRSDAALSNSRDKFILSRTYNQYQWKAFKATAPAFKRESRGGSDFQVPCGLGIRKRHPKGKPSNWAQEPDHNSDMRPSPVESRDDMSDDGVSTKRTEMGGIRRKHHKQWNLAEVMKLIDGVSQCGVGRWTDIKRLLFSASAHRTSVDLKDKWRNLLRASGAQYKNKRMGEQGRKTTLQPIPQPVLRRVCELAIIYPYPRDRTARLKCTPAIATPISAAVSGDTSVSRSGRTVHKKKST